MHNYAKGKNENYEITIKQKFKNWIDAATMQNILLYINLKLIELKKKSP